MWKSWLTKDVSAFFVRRFSSFTYLNVTQFEGALIDNIFKLLVVYFCIQIKGISESHKILALSGAIFVLPLLLFSSFSGTLADKFSKRNIIVFTKIFELVVMLSAILSFYFESPFGAYAVLFLLATQTAMFGPSKYGILPEIVSSEKISQANGILTSFTFLAIIIGTFFASFLLDVTNKSFLFAATFCASLSLVGLLTSFCIEYTPPIDKSKKVSHRFIHETWKALQIAREQPSLLTAIVSAAFFLFLGAFSQLNIIPFAVQSLGLSDTQGGYLFLLLALGIGIGSLFAGKISGKTVELALVPISGIGITLSLYLIDFLSTNLLAVIILMVIVGIFSGIYMVPLDSYIQIASPNEHRGKIVGATNFLSYFGVLVASMLLYLLTEVFGFEADKGFTVMGCIMLSLTVIVSFQYFDYCCRFVGMILSKLHFKTHYFGVDEIPEVPAVYVATHTAWNDMLLLLGAQRRRIRFFVEKEQEHSKWLKPLYRILRSVQIPTLQPLEKNQACLQAIRNNLDKGVSVCIFVESPDIKGEIEKIQSSYSFKSILQDTPYTMIPVVIEKGTKEKDHRFFTRVLEKCRVPAVISFGGMG
jgi:acyl-[acyl-carrier-protein]-phospholipid O-acyltransferase/long-chain-fatty-acid--[acyl-carrier-protein] ligase